MEEVVSKLFFAGCFSLCYILYGAAMGKLCDPIYAVFSGATLPYDRSLSATAYIIWKARKNTVWCNGDNRMSVRF